MVLKNLRKYMTVFGMSQPVRKTAIKLCFSYAMNFGTAVNLVVSWFYYNLNFVRTNSLTLNEAPMNYFMVGTLPVLLSECIYFTFNKQEVSDLIGQFESLVKIRKSIDFRSFKFTLIFFSK